MGTTRLFHSPEMDKMLHQASVILLASQSSGLRSSLGKALRAVSQNSVAFDDFCQINQVSIGHGLIGRVQAVIDDQGDQNIYPLSTSIYRFTSELNLAIAEDLPSDLRNFMKSVESEIENFPMHMREEIQWAQRDMPAVILKRILNSSEIMALRDVSKFADNVEKTIQGWEAKLEESEKTVLRLRDALEKHTKEFNFVGLREGFSELAEGVGKELNNARVYMAVFGVLALVPSIVELWLLSHGGVNLTKPDNSLLVLTGIGTVSITILVLYYFRIALRKADFCTAQLTQLRLRMSLCRFIQSYADYSAPIKEKNAEALSKFESIIFSSIVGSGEKLPSTFDGIEQLSALAKSMHSK
jgi:hypothetical protein